jgi:membrane-bound lytic murein transglycosylase MltF
MRRALYHYKWSPHRSVILILCLVLTSMVTSTVLGEAVMNHRPINRTDLHRIISQNHPNPKLVQAIIQVESEWNEKAVSSKGAIGLMQVLPASGKFYAGISDRKDLFCPETNIVAGTKILKYYQRTSPDLRTALNKYSGGAVGYFEKVMRRMKG